MATSFFSRWSQRKLEGEQASKVESDASNNLVDDSQSAELTELNQQEAATIAQQPTTTDTPDTREVQDACENTESEADSESPSVAQLLVSEASESVKKAALRKLFLSEEFNVRDGLDDYDDDYSNLKSLGEGVAETLRDWVKETVEEDTPVVNTAEEDTSSKTAPEKTIVEKSDTEEQESEEERSAAVKEAPLPEKEAIPKDTLIDEDESRH